MALLGAQFVNAVSPNPVGSLQAYAGPDAPTGWLLCDGSSYSTSAYPELYDAIGYTYGGSAGTFYVPDLRGRMPIGAGTGAQNGGSGSGAITGGTALTARSRGAFGGDERLASHNHTTNTSYPASFGGNNAYIPFLAATAPYTTDNLNATNSAGSGSGGNMPPFVVTNYIIKAQSDAPRSGLAYGSTPPIVTQLPSNPQFGDEVYFVESPQITMPGYATPTYSAYPSCWVYTGSEWAPTASENHICTVTVNNYSGFDVNNVFTSRYRNYRIIRHITSASAGGTINVQMKAGATNTTSGYEWVAPWWQVTGSTSIDKSASDSKWMVGYQTGDHGGIMYLYGPQTATGTHFVGLGVDHRSATSVKQDCSGALSNSIQYDGMYFSISSGTFTGTVSIYGLV